MIVSKVFFTDEYQVLESKIRDHINNQFDFLSTRTASSPRAVGDAIQDILEDDFDNLLGDYVKEYSSTFARSKVDPIVKT